MPTIQLLITDCNLSERLERDMLLGRAAFTKASIHARATYSEGEEKPKRLGNLVVA
jgi:hypothetical protein